jgi:tetratricopeptide (TPR) repeat protein
MKPRATCVALLVLALTPLTAGCNKLRARDELNKGVQAYKNGQFDTAIEHFNNAIEYDPQLLNARLYRATAYASQFVPGSPTEQNQKLGQNAIEGFLDVLTQDPNNTTALGYIASLYYGMAGPESDDQRQLEFFEKSKEYRRKLIQVEPQNPEHYYSIGVIDWAITYKRNMTLRGGKIPADQRLPDRDRRRLAEQNAALVEEGIQSLLKALELNPKYLDAMAYLNLIYRQKADIVDTPREREEYLQLADDLVERHKRTREAMQAAPPAAPPAQ